MADFKKALSKVLKWEAGYVNDPDDAGGETFAGVSRKNNKNWKGWPIIDKYKVGIMLPQDLSRLNEKLFADDKLMALVDELYKSNYWDPIQLDIITSQRIAEEIFDTAVNMGVGTAVKFAYEACGLEPSTKVTTELINTLVKIKS